MRQEKLPIRDRAKLSCFTAVLAQLRNIRFAKFSLFNEQHMQAESLSIHADMLSSFLLTLSEFST